MTPALFCYWLSFKSRKVSRICLPAYEALRGPAPSSVEVLRPCRVLVLLWTLLLCNDAMLTLVSIAGVGRFSMTTARLSRPCPR